ncbi:hypothetical protein AJ78_06321 [Emergomyces pasteurianus Ep9510]|uniref:non-specific serine/threonine protein kinase n=1 Tax=Emergomyces pasteurianus Ep9510 TaxID=1447872 RepID=A0A1J9PZ81_9EURO|nr:hypothetical protein AJ78_06321 [Emergomyces pasteurianus Ep9510]
MSSQQPLEPQIFPSTGFELIDPSVLLEEESIPNYKPQRFYPVRIGQIFNQQYQVVGKLGYGASSIVWLCCHDYVTLKIYINSSRTQRELSIYKHLEKVQSNHAGRQCLRFLLDSFEVTGPDGVHICLIHQPLGMSLYELKMRARGKVFNLHPNNVLMKIDDTSVFTEPLPFIFGPPVLCDLGEARLGDEEHQDDIMPDVYRAPEVWDLFEPDHLFKARNSKGQYDDAYHLAQMVAVLGLSLLDFIKRSTNSLKYWNENGDWRGLASIPSISLERLEQRLTGDDQERFLHFLRQMLRWKPED